MSTLPTTRASTDDAAGAAVAARVVSVDEAAMEVRAMEVRATEVRVHVADAVATAARATSPAEPQVPGARPQEVRRKRRRL